MSVSTYKQAAYLAIRDMIVELEIPPGARLVETDLAARLNVSKTPIREANALLESDGLVDITPYRGAMVRWLSTLEMEEQRFLIDAALAVGRYERIKAGDADAAAGHVRSCRDQIGQLNRSRLRHELVAPFFAPNR